MPSSGCKKSALRSEEHTSELQSHDNLVCRLLLETKTARAAALPSYRSTPRPSYLAPAPPGRARTARHAGVRAGTRAWRRRGGGGPFFFLKDAAPRENYLSPGRHRAAS